MWRSISVAACAAFVWGSVATADVVVLKNGDRVTGTIVTLADGKLRVKTDLMGEVTMDLANVQTFSTDEPITLLFKDGTVVHQKIASAEAGKVAVQPGGLIQPQPLALADLAAVNPPEKPKVTWEGHLTAGATFTGGNSLTQTESLDANLIRRTEEDRITVNGYYLYAQARDSNGMDEVTANKWFAGARYDYFLSKKWFMFANANYMRDQVADLEARAVGGLGAGYQWIESKPMNFNTDLGLGGMHEAYTNPSRTDNTIVGQVSYHFDKSLFSSLTFLHDLTFLPDLGGPSNFKVRTSAEMRAALSKALFASFKVFLDYDSQPAAGRERTDTEYILGVGVNF